MNDQYILMLIYFNDDIKYVNLDNYKSANHIFNLTSAITGLLICKTYQGSSFIMERYEKVA